MTTNVDVSEIIHCTNNKSSKRLLSENKTDMMEEFKINLAGEDLTVATNTDDSYTITKEAKRVGIIWPEQTDGGLIWKSDDLTMDQAMQIGELIEERGL
jgi:hypothetical protein